MYQLFSNAKKRLLAFIQFSCDLHVGLSDDGVWELDLFVTNKIAEKEPLNIIGFRVENNDAENIYEVK